MKIADNCHHILLALYRFSIVEEDTNLNCPFLSTCPLQSILGHMQAAEGMGSS